MHHTFPEVRLDRGPTHEYAAPVVIFANIAVPEKFTETVTKILGRPSNQPRRLQTAMPKQINTPDIVELEFAEIINHEQTIIFAARAFPPFDILCLWLAHTAKRPESHFILQACMNARNCPSHASQHKLLFL